MNTPNFKMRLKAMTPGSSGSKERRLSNPNNMAEAKVALRKISSREEQLRQAVNWCMENRCRGYSAIKSGLFPLVKNRRTVDKRLDGKITTG